MGGPPWQKAAVYTYKQAVYADQENFHDNKERSLPWGSLQARHQLTPPAQSWGWGAAPRLAVWPLSYSPIRRGCVPLSPQAAGTGQLREARRDLCVVQHPAFPAALQPRQRMFVPLRLPLRRQVPNSRQQFLPIKPCCPDPEGLVSQASQRQPECSLILPPLTLKDTLIN